MKLFTINATPARADVSEYENTVRINGYPKVVARILKRHGFDGFTIYQVQGYWMGESEVSFKIEIAMDDATTVRLLEVAGELRDMYNQDSVMVTYPNNTVDFI